jgi:tetratricopeptide (TPR) repeat protein
MGQLEESLAAFERAHKHNPKLRWVLTRLAVVYANLGRIEEARNTLEPLIKYYAGRGLQAVNLRFQMYLRPFKDKEVQNISREQADWRGDQRLGFRSDGYRIRYSVWKTMVD